MGDQESTIGGCNIDMLRGTAEMLDYKAVVEYVAAMNGYDHDGRDIPGIVAIAQQVLDRYREVKRRKSK